MDFKEIWFKEPTITTNKSILTSISLYNEDVYKDLKHMCVENHITVSKVLANLMEYAVSNYKFNDFKQQVEDVDLPLLSGKINDYDIWSSYYEQCNDIEKQKLRKMADIIYKISNTKYDKIINVNHLFVPNRDGTHIKTFSINNLDTYNKIKRIANKNKTSVSNIVRNFFDQLVSMYDDV